MVKQMEANRKEANMTTFNAGSTYHALDGEHRVHTYLVTKRTARFITINDRYGDTRRVAVHTTDRYGCEVAYPDGNHAASLVLYAETDALTASILTRNAA